MAVRSIHSIIGSATALVSCGIGAALFFGWTPSENTKTDYVQVERELNQAINGHERRDLAVITGSGKIRNGKATIKKGDVVSFALNYQLNEGPALIDLRAYIENLDKKSFKKGQSKVVWGYFSSKNYIDSDGKVKLDFAEDVTLHFKRLHWQAAGCEANDCASVIPFDDKNIFKSTGLLLGDVSNTDAYYKGGLVVVYDAH